jgi:hypothetical protein
MPKGKAKATGEAEVGDGLHLFTPYIREGSVVRAYLKLDDADHEKVKGRRRSFDVVVHDRQSDTKVRVRDADCGGGCRCAAVIVEEL